ncbi:MAG: HD family hydrolase [Euryarchaeota archaeon]
MDLSAIYRLKRVLRTGWLVRGVPRGAVESVAEHSFGAALLAWEVSRRLRERGVDVDPKRAVLLALVHDLPEAVALDLDAEASRVYGEAKRRAEERAARELLDDELLRLWREFERLESEEAKAAKLADVLDMALQALEYARVGFRDHREFVRSARETARELGPEYLEVFEELLKRGGKREDPGEGPG